MKLHLDFAPTDGLLVDLREACLTRLLAKSTVEVERQIVPVGNGSVPLGEICHCTRTTDEPDEIILEGDTGSLLYAGASLEAARVRIEGNAGPYTGAGMMGGEIEIQGDAGDCLGAGMKGGTIRVRSTAGDWCGAALPGKPSGMSGGTILVGGNAGREAGAFMRRGLVVINGEAGEAAGAYMLAGTVLCFGQLGASAGVGMKRGSILGRCCKEILPGFRAAGEADPEWLKLYLTWLARQGWVIPEWLKQPTLRFSGDHLSKGKGEILLHEILE